MIFKINGIDLVKGTKLIAPITPTKFDRVKVPKTALNGDLKLDTPVNPKYSITFTFDRINEYEIADLLDALDNTFFNVVFKNNNYDIDADFTAVEHPTPIADLVDGVVNYSNITFTIEQR